MNWPMVPLGEIAEIVGGSTPRRDEPDYWGEGYYWATPTDLPMPGEGILDLESTAQTITSSGLRSCSTNLLPVGAVLYSTRATIGKLAIAKVPVATNQGFNNLIAGPAVYNRYLAYALQYYTPDISRLAGSTTFKEVSRSSLRGVKIPVPPRSEQHRIVELLDEADRLRRLRREADAKAARILPALFLKMFGDPATNPMGWPVEPLVKICSPKQWPTISSKELTELGFPVYGANGKIGFYSMYNHERPTVLITCRGATCGTINVCEPKSYVTGNAMALDDPDLEKTSIEFLECYLNVRGLNDTITGAAQPQITRQNLQVVTVFVPPPGLVSDFSRHVRATKDLLVSVRSGGDRLEDAFRLLLQRAFSGQLTAKWREAHMKELLAEMQEQARLLNLPLPTEAEVFP